MSDLEVESSTASQHSGPARRRNSRGLLPQLLIDYTAKLEHVRKQFKEVTAQLKNDSRNALYLNEKATISHYFEKMQPHLDRLARVASAQLAHGKFGSISRIEIELRLAEFEASLSATEALIGAKP